MIYKFIVPILATMLLFGAGYGYGKISATKKYEPQLAELRAALDTADVIGKAQIAKGKEALDVTAKQNNSSIAAIRARYERMLRDAKGNNNSGTVAASSCGIDATGGEQRAIEFEQSCALDANKVTQWQEWARRNQIPIAE